MINLLNYVAVILILIWAVGFFGYSMGGLLHIVLVLAIVSIVLRLLRVDRMF
jgi:hypothetical protein